MNTRTLLVVALASLGACSTEPDRLMFELQADRFAGSAWSEPVNLGPVINTGAVEANAALSADGLALYFVSNRAGGLGGNDIWLSRRQCSQCPWATPVNLGAPVNSDAGDGAPTLSENGRLLFFFSTRAGGIGSADIYVSHRVSTSAAGDVWGAPVNLGPDINTAGLENGSYHVRVAGESNVSLFFNRVPAGGSLDIFRAYLSHDGVPLGPAEPVSELNDQTGADQKVTVRADGLELLLSSARSGTFGGFDIWAFSRQTVQDPWGTPVHLDAAINTPDIDSQPSLSRDGRTLIFTSNRSSGGQGQQDLWMATRTPIGQ